jgi:hypothetical protein
METDTMRLLTPADEPLTSEVLSQALTYLALWRGPLAQALEPVGETASLDNAITALALALVDTTDAEATADQRKLAQSVLEQEPEDSSYHGWLKAQGYIPATDQEEPADPADGLFHTLDQVKAHAAAAAAAMNDNIDDLFPVEPASHE